MSAESRILFLAEPFQSDWQNKDPFYEVQKINSAAQKNNVYREKEGRRTLRFEYNRKSYFLKHHAGIGWKEILKNLVQLRLPVLGARNEYLAAKKLKLLAIDTLTPAAYGCRGKNPAKQESFLITEDLNKTISLEDYCKKWIVTPPSFRTKIALIKKVAQMAAVMHKNGINHRDFYICHLLLENEAAAKINTRQDFNCYLIDLHRCQIRQKVPYRWLIKDLGGLLYSTMDIGFSARDYFRFIKVYTGKPLKEVLHEDIWQDIKISAEKLYQKDFKKLPPALFRVGK